MRDPREQIKAYGDVCDLLDAACARLEGCCSDEGLHESTRSYLLSIHRAVGFERRSLSELKRATHELVDCHCEGMSHERECPAAP